MLWLLLACGPPEPPPRPPGPVELSAPPWVLLTGPTSAVLRFETVDAHGPLVVRIDGVVHNAAQDALQSDYAWPPEPNDAIAHNDVPGLRVVHSVALTDLDPGQVVSWSVDQGQGVQVHGSFWVPPPAGTPFRAVFTGDTMAPYSADVMAAAATWAPDLFLHGGDLQYRSNPMDTWSGLMYALEPLTRQAPFHPAIGNHEDEGLDEFEVLYTRFFQGAGDSGDGVEWYGQTFGGVRFLSLNSEALGGLSDATHPQVEWLVEELDAHRHDTVVVYFHRPSFSLGKHGPNVAIQELTHPLFRDHGVDLVLTAHNHAYERFEIDGVHYVTDGGGGALLYGVDDHIDDHPELEPLRHAAESSRGFTVLDFPGDGTIELTRVNDTGRLTDQATLLPPSDPE